MSYMSYVKITLHNRSYKGLVHPQIGHEAVAGTETSRAARQEKTFESGPQKGQAIYSHMDVVWLDASSGSPTQVDV